MKIIFVLTIITLSFSFYSRKKLNIDGVWSIVEVQTVKPNGSFTSVFPKESQAIFVDNYYSFTWTSHSTAIHSWQLPDSVKLDRVNQTIVNSGSFAINDSILSTKATFASNPMFVNGEAKFKCSVKDDTLILTGLSVASSDNILHPLYMAGSHIVNKLVRLPKQ